jgi:hypothetical protein
LPWRLSRAAMISLRSRFNAPRNHIVCLRNGNPFDIRLANLVSISRGLVRQAKLEAARGPDYSPRTCGGAAETVTLARPQRPRARGSE